MTISAKELANALGKAAPSGSGWMALCPVHDDRNPSLSITDGTDGRLLVKCHAGCGQEAVVEKLKARGLWPKRNSAAGNRIVQTYDYLDASGNLLYQVVRYDPKGFSQRQPDGYGGWNWNMKGVERVLYRLPEVIQGMAKGRTVFVAEGEKDVDALVKLGLCATCNSGGAGKWTASYSEVLAGARVTILGDNDAPGWEHAEKVARALHGKAGEVRVAYPPEGYKDASDWIAQAGATDADFRGLRAGPVWKPGTVAPKAPEPGKEQTKGPYLVSGGQICWRKSHKEGVTIVPLSNFDARIASEVTRDDGAEKQRHFRIEGNLSNGAQLLPVDIPVSRFSAMNWPSESWGASAVVAAGLGAKDHLRAAIQSLSKTPASRTTFTHLGWRKIDGEWAYLHGGGTIGRNGVVVDVDVDIGDSRIRHFALPEAPPGTALAMAIQASLDLIKLAPTRISIPLLAAAFRAPLGEALPVDFAIHLAGPTGANKTSLACVIQAHYGRELAGTAPTG
jgi:5S rRNA maturation endonuclease (ribonuclease M5)